MASFGAAMPKHIYIYIYTYIYIYIYIHIILGLYQGYIRVILGFYWEENMETTLLPKGPRA